MTTMTTVFVCVLTALLVLGVAPAALAGPDPADSTGNVTTTSEPTTSQPCVTFRPDPNEPVYVYDC